MIYYVAFDSTATLRVDNSDGTYWGRRVSKYMIFNDYVQSDALTEAVSIVVNDNGIMHWLKKDGHFIGRRNLTVDENNQLLLQLLRSEEWTPHLNQTW